ncbi:CPBP family intramembrane metalloprotease [Bacillus timonensis]|nr:CPBP family intramembrane metalloprotease [Bacillus timonensis]
MFRKQAEVVKMMKDKEILFHLYLTQGLLLIVSVVLGFIFFDNIESFFFFFDITDLSIFVYGGTFAFGVLMIEWVLIKVFPKEMFDDGGINEKVFRGRNVFHILFLVLIISFTEEILFRGIIQTQFGLITASIVFGLLHFRYLNKLLLFLLVMVISFMLGLIFEWTGNLFVTIFSHFLIDLVFAIKIRMDYLKSLH